MAFTITVMQDTQTHAVVMTNFDGVPPNNIATIELGSLLGAGQNAFGGASTVARKVTITKIQSSCSPPSTIALPGPNDPPNPPRSGYNLGYGGINDAELFIGEGNLDFDNLNLIMVTPTDITIAPLDESTRLTVILTLKKIKGFAGSASLAKIG